MTLSEYEERTLCGIEAGCRRDDPGFVRRLDLGVAVNRHRQALTMARAAIWLGLLVALIGSGTARGVVSTGAVIAFYGAVLLVAGVVGWLRLRTPRSGGRGRCRS